MQQNQPSIYDISVAKKTNEKIIISIISRSNVHVKRYGTHQLALNLKNKKT